MTAAIGRLHLTITLAPTANPAPATVAAEAQVSRVERLFRRDQRLSSAAADRSRWESMPFFTNYWGR